MHHISLHARKGKEHHTHMYDYSVVVSDFNECELMLYKNSMNNLFQTTQVS